MFNDKAKTPDTKKIDTPVEPKIEEVKPVEPNKDAPVVTPKKDDTIKA
ncbi:hypothetical protein [Sulfurospirillum sp. hDNRA2]|jgi:hypothetical protein|nr:hypothetical protein [Sulfurospirillum sp. DNRA8]MCP3651390.1 hypothetical protein [Sulfurospirillum sp. DNRA8]MCR1810237.1 hypothetical protein [Sulfurospirillum sp. DNRA8]